MKPYGGLLAPNPAEAVVTNRKRTSCLLGPVRTHRP